MRWVGLAVAALTVAAAPAEATGFALLDARLGELVRAGRLDEAARLAGAQADPRLAAFGRARVELAGDTAARLRAAERLAQLAADLPAGGARGLVGERRADAHEALVDWPRVIAALEAAQADHAAARDRRAELRVVVRLAETLANHGPAPGAARAHWLRAAVLAADLGDAAAEARVRQGLSDWAAQESRAAALGPQYGGAIDEMPFRGNLGTEGGALRVGPSGLLYLQRDREGHSLARFDGSFLEELPLPGDPRLLGLALLPDGSLAAGTPEGAFLSDPDGTRFVRLDVPETTGAIAADGAGGLWIAVTGGAVRWRRDGGVVERLPLPPFAAAENEVVAFDVTPDGRLFLVSHAGVEAYEDGQVAYFLRAETDVPNDTRHVVPEADGTVWMISTQGAVRFRGRERLGELSPLAMTGNPSVRSLLRAEDGTLWLGLGRGVARQAPGEDSLGVFVEKGDRFEQVYGLVEWAGAVWIMNQLGALVRLDAPFATVHDRRVLPSGWIFRVVPADEGGFLVGTGMGLTWFDPDGPAVRYHGDPAHCEGVMPLLTRAPGAIVAGSEVDRCVMHLAASGTITTLRPGAGLPDGDPRTIAVWGGRPCVGSTRGIWCLEPDASGKVVAVTPPELAAFAGKSISARDGLLEDRDGWLLVSVDDDGLWRVPPPGRGGAPERVAGLDLRTPLALSDTGAEILVGSADGTRRWHERALALQPGVPRGAQTLEGRRLSDGTLLLSLIDSGLMLSDGEDWLTLRVEDGLPSLMIRAIAETQPGRVWLGTGGSGLVELRWDRSRAPETMILSHGKAHLVDRGRKPRRLDVVALRAPGAGRLPEDLGVRPDDQRWLESTAGVFAIPRAQALPLVDSARHARTTPGAEPSLLALVAETPAVDPVPYTDSRVVLGITAVSAHAALPPEKHIYRWRVDGGPWQVTRGGTQLVLEGLAEGEHTVEVVAKGWLLAADATAAVLRFRVDLPRPWWFFPAIFGGVGLAGLLLRRRIVWGYLRLRHLRYRPIPEGLYAPRGPITARAELSGRDAELAEIAARAERARRQGASIVLWGDPQSGRTSLLRCVSAAPGDVVVFVDVARASATSVGALLGAVGEAILAELGARGIALPAGEGVAAGSTASAMGRDTPVSAQVLEAPGGKSATDGAFDATVQVEVKVSPQNPYRGFERLIGAVRQALDGRTLVLLLDNGERLRDVMADDSAHGGYLLAFLKGLVSASPGLLLVVALTGDRSELDQRFRALLDISTLLPLAPLPLEASEELLRAGGAGAVVVPARAMARLHALAGGNPRILLSLAQTLARLCAESRRNLVSSSAVTRAATTLAGEPIPAYTALWAELPGKVKLTLSLLADLPEGTTIERAVEISHSRRAPVLEEELRRIIAAQVRDGRLRLVEGRVEFVAGLLRAWVAAAHPFAVAVEESRDFVGPYQVLETLGEGGMGTVYKARDMVSGQIVALKVLAKSVADSREAQQRFLREAKLGLKLRHPNIVRILARGEHAGHGYIAMELVEGRTLRQRVRVAGPYTWKEAAPIALALAEAIAEIHRHGIVHRDIKSENVMLAGAAEVPMIMDFGLAHRADLSQLTGGGRLVGTLAYVAPEQVAGEDASPSWDLYAFGTVLYEMLTGEVPFAGLGTVALLKAIASTPPKPLSEHGVELPEDAETLIMSMLAKTAVGRPVSAEVVVAELRRLEAEVRPPSAPAPTISPMTS